MREFKKMLHNGVCQIKFKKSDGTIREINKATTQPDMLPAREPNTKSDKPTVKRAPNPEVLKFYSIDDKGWRSCRLDTILEFNGE